MKLVKFSAIAVAAALIAGQAQAADHEDAKKTAENLGCLMCHQVDKKVIGPAYQDVAKKYKDDKKAADKLYEKVAAGGKGAWGDMPMPAQNPDHDKTKEKEIKSVIHWVLSLK
jgi:cytochrome c